MAALLRRAVPGAVRATGNSTRSAVAVSRSARGCISQPNCLLRQKVWTRTFSAPKKPSALTSFLWIHDRDGERPLVEPSDSSHREKESTSRNASAVRSQCEVILQHATEGRIDHAEECLAHLMVSRRRSLLDNDTPWIAKGIVSILQAYARSNSIATESSLRSTSTGGTSKRHLVDRADRLVQSIDDRNLLDVASYDLVLCALMDVYISANMLSRAESVFLQLDQRRLAPYLTLMQAYGDDDRADQTTRLLHRVLKDTHVDRPTLELFNVAVKAWTKSTRSDVAFHQAFSALRLMEYDDGCLTARVRPDRNSFHLLLECLMAHGYRVVDEHDDGTANRAGLMASVILDSMHEFMRQGDELVRPNAQTYELAIQVCLRADDTCRADSLSRQRDQLKLQNDLSPVE